MIPLLLTVKNFMCYRDDVPTLDLEGIDIACLCGDNGHGKTALLDAITWALWGQARARTLDELVHQGQQDMAVELEFLARDQRYRVSRRYSRRGRSRQGTTLLELQITSPNGTRPITGNTVRRTEEQIIKILNMEYDTFVNTAFLRQGDADSFTTSKPSDRKETLAKVLDLSYYQGLEERAKGRSRTIQDKIRDVESAVSLRQQEIAQRPEYERELASAKTTMEGMRPQVEEARRAEEEVRQRVNLLQSQRPELQKVAQQLEDERRDLLQLEKQVHGHEAKVQEYETILPREPEIREKFASLEKSRGELERLNQAFTEKSALDGEMVRLGSDVTVEKERVLGKVKQLQKNISEDLEPKVGRLPEIEKGLLTLDQEQLRLAGQEETIGPRREEAQRIADRVRDLESANDRLRGEMEDTRSKFDMLDAGKSMCPLCNQPLGPEGQEHLRSEYEAQGHQTKKQYQANASEHRLLEGKQRELTAQLSQLETDLRDDRQQAENRAVNLQRDKAESQNAHTELRPARTQVEELQSKLASEDFAQDARRKLSALGIKVAALQYHAERHQDARAQSQELESYVELDRKLREASEGLPTEREALETTRQIIGRRQEQLRDADERRAGMEEALKSLPTLEQLLKDTEVRHQALSQQENSVLIRQGVLERQIDRCKSLEAEVREQEQRRSRLVNGKSIYDELAVAFGKNGVQALIIESAIPELQDDANILLGRLTENRMSLKLQLQEGRKDSRTGVPSEELDIKIADEVGTRSYETFSGGEAFRINFALRIALSKLLARRSGAPLPILFIDEGFGSQDRTGQERLTEAIQSIQDDFQKIIVITHLENIKEAFPVRIEVTKTGAGSTFVVA